MTQLTRLNGIVFDCSVLVPQGRQLLWRGNEPVWSGPLGAPIEDVEFDRITVNTADFERIVAATVTAERP